MAIIQIIVNFQYVKVQMDVLTIWLRFIYFFNNFIFYLLFLD